MTDLEKAHAHSFKNQEEVRSSGLAGCFYCQRVFPPAEIKEWVDRHQQTAICPHCSIDAVIGDQSGYPVTDQRFLAEMHERWFARYSRI